MCESQSLRQSAVRGGKGLNHPVFFYLFFVCLFFVFCFCFFVFLFFLTSVET